MLRVATMERFYAAIQGFCDVVIKIKTSQSLRLNLLQKGLACTDVINSYVKQPSSASFVGTEEFSQLQQCIPPALIDLISGEFNSCCATTLAELYGIYPKYR